MNATQLTPQEAAQQNGLDQHDSPLGHSVAPESKPNGYASVSVADGDLVAIASSPVPERPTHHQTFADLFPLSAANALVETMHQRREAEREEAISERKTGLSMLGVLFSLFIIEGVDRGEGWPENPHHIAAIVICLVLAGFSLRFLSPCCEDKDRPTTRRGLSGVIPLSVNDPEEEHDEENLEEKKSPAAPPQSSPQRAPSLRQVSDSETEVKAHWDDEELYPFSARSRVIEYYETKQRHANEEQEGDIRNSRSGWGLICAILLLWTISQSDRLPEDIYERFGIIASFLFAGLSMRWVPDCLASRCCTRERKFLPSSPPPALMSPLNGLHPTPIDPNDLDSYTDNEGQPLVQFPEPTLAVVSPSGATSSVQDVVPPRPIGESTYTRNLRGFLTRENPEENFFPAHLEEPSSPPPPWYKRNFRTWLSSASAAVPALSRDDSSDKADLESVQTSPDSPRPGAGTPAPTD